LADAESRDETLLVDFFEETPIPASVDMPTATLHYQTAFTR
jgi:hypothetical protein